MKIESGIWRVDTISGVNVYLVEAEDGSLVAVDTGMPGHASKIIAYVEGPMGRSVEDISRIVITHADPDHVGGAAELALRSGAPIYVSERDAGVLAGTEPNKMSRTLLGKLLTMVFRHTPISADGTLGEGDEVPGGFVVLAVPGHTGGSIALWREADGVLITGDTVLGARDGSPKKPQRAVTEDMDAALRGHERLLALDPRLVLPGHGPVMTLR